MINRYLASLAAYVDDRWNRFWFLPSYSSDLDRLRVVVGVWTIIWHFSYSWNLSLWSGADGWLSLSALKPVLQIRPPVLTWLSMLSWSDASLYLWTVHVLSSIVLILFTAGFYLPWTTIGSAYVVLSYVQRFSILHGPVEPILVFVLLYLCIASLGSTWTLHGAKQRQTQSPSTRNTIARRLIQVHLVLLYLYMALSQLAGETWWHAEAIWWLGAQPYSRIANWNWLRENPTLLNLWTYAVVVTELLFVVAIWKPIFRPLLLIITGCVFLSVGLVSANLPLAITLIVANLAFANGVSSHDNEACEQADVVAS